MAGSNRDFTVKYLFMLGMFLSGMCVFFSAFVILDHDYIKGVGLFALGVAGVLANLWGVINETE